MRSSTGISLAVGVVLSFLLAAQARGELMGRDTLELRVARADVVVCARVVTFDFHKAELGLTERLKGQPPPRIKVPIAPGWYSVPSHPGEEGLFLLRSTDHGTLELDSSPFATSVVWLGDNEDRPDAFTMDFAAPRGREAILTAVRAAATAPKPAKVISIAPPPMTDAFKQLAGGESGFLRMPVDARLQKVGERWATRGYHQQAILAMREFRSDENARRIEAILHEEERRPSAYSSGGEGRLAWKYFPIRDLAWYTLGDWNVRVPRPVIWEPQDLYRPLHWLLVIVVMLVLATPAAVTTVRSRRGRRIANGATAVFATLALLGALLWLHTRGRRGDELYYDGATRQVWLSSFGGGLQLTMIADWTPGEEHERYNPMMDWIDQPSTQATLSPPPRHIPRGLLWGAIPDLFSLWNIRCGRVNTERDWLIAVAIEGTQQDWGRSGRFPMYRYQMNWWLAIMLLAAYPLLRVIFVTSAVLRARHRRRHGLCVDCGYDLRGSGDRCPECGVAAAAAAAAAAK